MSGIGQSPRTMPAGEFKNRCLALMDEVNETGEEIVITKHGEPVARLAPVREPVALLGMFRDRMSITCDIMSPAVPAVDWEVISNPDRVLDPDRPFHQ